LRIIRTYITLPKGTWGAYKANLIGFLGEIFAAFYLMSNYPVLEGDIVNIIRNQVRASNIRALFYGLLPVAETSPFVPRIIDQHILSAIWIP